jgi:dipeptidyl aminopeptidase/acylaminoacyl peptidase
VVDVQRGVQLGVAELRGERLRVLYTNPRGSTGYGQEFVNGIQYSYPGKDYDDLMAGVDEALKKGWVDERNLFVCGGSGGGVLTAWIVGSHGPLPRGGIDAPGDQLAQLRGDDGRRELV